MSRCSATRFAVTNRRIDLAFCPADLAGPRSLALAGNGAAARLLQVALPLVADAGAAPLLRGRMKGWSSDLVFNRNAERR